MKTNLNYESLKVGMLIRRAGISKGPKSVVTHIGSDYAVAVHPDFGAFRIYRNQSVEFCA